MLVDDADNVRAVLRAILEQDSIEVVEAKGGHEALAILRSDPTIGLMFLDMHMPDVGGLDVLRLLRADPALAHVPVVVLTGSAPSLVAAAKELGAVGWLQKPVRVDSMLKVARVFLPL